MAELVDERHALIDRVTIYGVAVVDIKEQGALITMGVLSIKAGVKNYAMTARGQEYSAINIKNTAYCDLFASYTGRKKGEQLGILTLSVGHEKTYNLNCFSADAIQQRLEKVKDCLWQDYGILIDYGNAKYKSLEINKTITLRCAYEDYKEPLLLIMASLPGTLRLGGNNIIEPPSRPLQCIDKNMISAGTMRRKSGKTGLGLKIYDKARQLRKVHNVNINDNILRCEITLTGAKKIKHDLGTNVVSEITDDCINQYYSNFVRCNIIDANNKKWVVRVKMLKKIINEVYIPGSHTWIYNLIVRIQAMEKSINYPLLLDYTELHPLVDDILKGKSRKMRYNIRKRISDFCRENDIYCTDGTAKINELFDKLS